MTTEAQQIALDNELVAPENRHVIGKCNMRINPRMKPNKPTYQVVLDALALTTCYLAFLITAEVPIIYMHQFWATISKHTSSHRFKIERKDSLEVFREILNICPKVPGKEFDEPSTKEEALSFIRELGHSGEIGQADTQIYGTILPKAMTNQALLDSIAYKTYYAIASRAKHPKSRKSQKKSESAISSEESPSKKKPTKAMKMQLYTQNQKTTKKKETGKADIARF
ncbi:hypothetical protein Tco_0780032 [Tanacetum coccineum]